VAREVRRFSALIGDGPGGAIPLRFQVQLTLGPQDAAPLAVFGNRHPALDTNPHPLALFGAAGEQLLEKRQGHLL